jgi:hypothetical protein
MSKLFMEIVLYIAGMKPKHRITNVRISIYQIKDQWN